jgi:DNA gyrase subunit A
LDKNERITAVLPVPSFEGDGYLTMITRQGKIKRTNLTEFSTVRAAGLIAINLEPGDELGWVRLTRGREELILVTERGQAIRFSEEDVRPTGRSSGGVTAIRLADGDAVAGADIVTEDGELMVISARGWAKRTPLKEYSVQSRAGSGVQTFNIKNMDQTGPIAWARVVHPGEEVTIITSNGQAMRTSVAAVSLLGRATRGATLMNVEKSDTVACVARMAKETVEVSRGEEPAVPDENGAGPAK